MLGQMSGHDVNPREMSVHRPFRSSRVVAACPAASSENIGISRGGVSTVIAPEVAEVAELGKVGGVLASNIRSAAAVTTIPRARPIRRSGVPCGVRLGWVFAAIIA